MRASAADINDDADGDAQDNVQYARGGRRSSGQGARAKKHPSPRQQRHALRTPYCRVASTESVRAGRRGNQFREREREGARAFHCGGRVRRAKMGVHQWSVGMTCTEAAATEGRGAAMVSSRGP